MPAPVHLRPALDVIHPLSHRTRWAQHLLRKLNITGRYIDASTFWDWPWAMHTGIVGPEGRSNRPSYPVEHDVREQLILGEDRLHIAPAIAPAAELFDDPGRQPHRRIGQSKGKGLRLGSLVHW